MRRISKADREAAIEALLCCADCEWLVTQDFVSGNVDFLADRAFSAVFHLGVLEDRSIYLEAAALLRDGWSPGDPVVRRGGGS